MCELPHETRAFVWFIDDKTVQELIPELPAERGITSDNVLVRENNRSFAVISNPPKSGE